MSILKWTGIESSEKFCTRSPPCTLESHPLDCATIWIKMNLLENPFDSNFRIRFTAFAGDAAETSSASTPNARQSRRQTIACNRWSQWKTFTIPSAHQFRIGQWWAKRRWADLSENWRYSVQIDRFRWFGSLRQVPLGLVCSLNQPSVIIFKLIYQILFIVKRNKSKELLFHLVE